MKKLWLDLNIESQKSIVVLVVLGKGNGKNNDNDLHNSPIPIPVRSSGNKYVKNNSFRNMKSLMNTNKWLWKE